MGVGMNPDRKKPEPQDNTIVCLLREADGQIIEAPRYIVDGVLKSGKFKEVECPKPEKVEKVK